MKSAEVRRAFLDYFARHGHAVVESSGLVPRNDPTLLFTNAGMNQFKDVFLGLERPASPRATTAQKCLRAGGKHNDLENVGQTARHHTFFEMMGNFSFGDYFKADAIRFAWELVTRDFGMDKDRLYVTVFQDDDEAADIWHRQEGVPRDRIYRFGEKDNFWRMGDAGPCGPCSEIFYDLGPGVPGSPKDNVMGGDGDRYMEIWNLVFMQYEEDGRGGRTKLPKPSVDTGGGLERMATVLQGKVNNYDTDLFQDLIGIAAARAGVEYRPDQTSNATNTALRVLADHARAAAFLIADGVLPSNEGRGYVLRRILRRAIRYGRGLDAAGSIFPPVVGGVIAKMSPFYRELERQKTLIERTVVDEERRFLATLDQGTFELGQALAKLPGGGTLAGQTVFRLYDTFGFPVDLTRLMAAERGFKVDGAGFEKALGRAKEVARASWKGKGLTGDQAHVVAFANQVRDAHGITGFTGYENAREVDAKLIALSDGSRDVTDLAEGASGILVSDKTCFYAEGGGPVGDRGTVRAAGGEGEIFDTTKHSGVFLHHVRVTDGKLGVGDRLHLEVSTHGRRSIANNHSATHLMHAALRRTLGTHVGQAGSLVEADRLRFDFTHGQPLGAAQIAEVEALVNDEIAKGIQVQSETMAHQAALDRGALAMFGEKYGADVRVVQMGEFSMELCGGIHVNNTAEIRFFKIVAESGVSAGVRRIEAITGQRATDYLSALSREALAAREKAGLAVGWQKYLEGSPTSLESWVMDSQSVAKGLRADVQKLKGGGIDVDALVASAENFAGGRFVFALVPVDDRKVLSDLSDRLRDRLVTAIVVVLGEGEASHPLIVSVSKSLVAEFNAGKILGEMARILGGKGGGRPDFAQGSVPSRDAVAEARAWLRSRVGA